MKYKIVTSADLWTAIEALGDFEQDFKNGELWCFDGNFYYLSILNLSPKELQELKEFYNF